MFPTAKLISLSLNSNKRKALVGNFDFSSAWFIYPWDRPEQGILPAQDRLIKLFQVSQVFALCQPAPVAKSLVIADLPTLRKNIHGLNASLITAKRQSSYGQKDINVILVSFSFIIFHTALESSSEGAGMYFSSYTWQRPQNSPLHAKQHCYIASQWLAQRGQIFARYQRSHTTPSWPGLCDKPKQAWDFPVTSDSPLWG